MAQLFVQTKDHEVEQLKTKQKKMEQESARQRNAAEAARKVCVFFFVSCAPKTHKNVCAQEAKKELGCYSVCFY